MGDRNYKVQTIQGEGTRGDILTRQTYGQGAAAKGEKQRESTGNHGPRGRVRVGLAFAEGSVRCYNIGK